MKVKVDKDACIGCGLCEAECPKVFRMTGEGVAEEIQEKVPEGLERDVESARDQCPVGAILTEDE